MNKRNSGFYSSKWRHLFYFLLMMIVIIHFFYYPKEGNITTTQETRDKENDYQSNITNPIPIQHNHQNILTKEVTVIQMEDLIKRQEKEKEAMQNEEKEEILNLIFITHNFLLILFITLFLIVYMSAFIDDDNCKQSELKETIFKQNSNLGYTLLFDKDEKEIDI